MKLWSYRNLVLFIFSEPFLLWNLQFILNTLATQKVRFTKRNPNKHLPKVVAYQKCFTAYLDQIELSVLLCISARTVKVAQ